MAKERERIIQQFKAKETLIGDSHTHAGGVDVYNLYTGRRPCQLTVVELEQKLEREKVHLAICFPFPFPPYYDIETFFNRGERVFSGCEPLPYHVNNQTLLRETQDFPFIFPFIGITPRTKIDAQGEMIIEWATEYSFYGMKFHPKVEGLSAEDLHETVFLKIARRFGLPLMIHSGVETISRAENVVRLAQKNPDLRFCIAHAGRLDDEVLDFVKAARNPNLFLDVAPFLFLFARKTGTPFSYKEELLVHGAIFLEKLLEKFPFTLMWGTDFPYTKLVSPKGEIEGCSYHDELAVLFLLPYDAKKAIAHDNLLRFLGL